MADAPNTKDQLEVAALMLAAASLKFLMAFVDGKAAIEIAPAKANKPMTIRLVRDEGK